MMTTQKDTVTQDGTGRARAAVLVDEVSMRLRPLCQSMSDVCFRSLVADVVVFKLKWESTGSPR